MTSRIAIDSISDVVKKASYAVRGWTLTQKQQPALHKLHNVVRFKTYNSPHFHSPGPIVAKAMELQKLLQEGADLPFKKVISCNIGNPQVKLLLH